MARLSVMNRHAGRMVQRFTKLDVDTVQFLRQTFLYTAPKQFDLTFDPILCSVHVRGIVSETSSSVDISSRSNWGKLGHSRTFLGKLPFFGLLMSMNGKI